MCFTEIRVVPTQRDRSVIHCQDVSGCLMSVHIMQTSTIKIPLGSCRLVLQNVRASVDVFCSCGRTGSFESDHN